jgi:hypothetical protein
MKKRICAYFSVLVLVSSTVAAQIVQRNLLQVSISSRVVRVDSAFAYKYKVTNDAKSQQRLEVLRIEVADEGIEKGGTIEHFLDPDGWFGWADRIVGQPIDPSAKGTIVWVAEDSASNFSDLMIPAQSSLLPESTAEFSFQSEGLPSTKRFWARGWARPLWEYEYDSLLALGYTHDQIYSPWYDDAYTGVTVGPQLPARSFDSDSFLDTITSYINQSRTLGWITNDPTANKYRRLIDTARFHLQANNRGVTKAKLDSVLVNVYPDSTAGVITSEAYALLRFNTEYVLKKLREEDSTFAAENKSSSWDATATNNARHLAKTENSLHEVFTSGGEVFYRRSQDGGSSWDQTHCINTAFGEHSHSCIATTQSGTVQIVWQRRIAPALYEVWHASSNNNGETWSTAAPLPGADSIPVSPYQSEGAMPVIVERQPGYLVAVYCSDEGLRYRTSTDDGQTWITPSPDIIGGRGNDRVRSPSLASDGNMLWLAYDYANDPDGPYARTFDGTTWSDEVSIATGTDTDLGTAASIAVDEKGYPLVTWSGVSTNLQWGRVVVVCLGYPDNTWSKWFSMFGQNVYDWLNPSTTYYRDREARYGIAVVNHTAQNHIKLIRLQSFEPPAWSISTLSTTGAWPGITADNAFSGTPLRCWTDQSSSPYEIVVGSSEEVGKATPSVSLKHTRIAVVRTRNSTLTLEMEPLKVVLAAGDTIVLAFKPSALRQRNTLTLATMWQFLGSDIVELPATARRLVLSKRFTVRGPSFAQRRFALQMLDSNGRVLAALDTTATSGTVSIDIAPYAGRSVTLRPQLTLSGIAVGSASVGVGDVFMAPQDH